MNPALLRLVGTLPREAPSATPPGRRSLVLTSEQRAKTRFRATLSDGSDAIVLLPRGSVVRAGTRLVAESGEIVVVVAAAEQVYRVGARADAIDPVLDLVRAAYHLGNRHVPVELDAGVVKLERDAVLRDLLLHLGLDVATAFEPFEPEPGAYGGGHRHDVDPEGGAIGETLSQDAHSTRSPAPRPSPASPPSPALPPSPASPALPAPR